MGDVDRVTLIKDDSNIYIYIYIIISREKKGEKNWLKNKICFRFTTDHEFNFLNLY